jgi:hypothetical protein
MIAPMPIGVGLLILYLAGSALSGVLIDAPGDAGWRWTWRYLALPIAVLVAGSAWRRRDVGAAEAGRRRRPWLTALVAYGLLMLGAPSYVLLVNALGARPDDVTVAGPVLGKWTRSYRTTRHSLQILDEESGQKLTLRVSPADYRTAAVGTRVSRGFRRGRLGLLYRWTFG